MSILDNLIVNLRIVSKIPEGGKICTTGAGQIRIEDTKTLDGWISAGKRRLTGDSRDQAVKTLMQIINDVEELSDNIIDSLKTGLDNSNHQSPGALNENNKKCRTLRKLSNMLKNSKRGLSNLHKTYADDANVTARLDEVMDKIDTQFDAINQVLDYMRINKHLDGNPNAAALLQQPQQHTHPHPHPHLQAHPQPSHDGDDDDNDNSHDIFG